MHRRSGPCLEDESCQKKGEMTGTIKRAHSAVLTVMPPVEVEAVRTLVNLWLLPADAELARADAAVEAVWASRISIGIALD